MSPPERPRNVSRNYLRRNRNAVARTNVFWFNSFSCRFRRKIFESVCNAPISIVVVIRAFRQPLYKTNRWWPFSIRGSDKRSTYYAKCEVKLHVVYWSIARSRINRVGMARIFRSSPKRDPLRNKRLLVELKYIQWRFVSFNSSSELFLNGNCSRGVRGDNVSYTFNICSHVNVSDMVYGVGSRSIQCWGKKTKRQIKIIFYSKCIK